MKHFCLTGTACLLLLALEALAKQDTGCPGAAPPPPERPGREHNIVNLEQTFILCAGQFMATGQW